MPILETKNLKKVYGSGETAVHALRGVSLSVLQSEFVAVVGTSGSGKSTLLHMLGGLDRPTAGEVIVDGKPIFTLKDEELTVFRRRKIGFVFQDYNLVPELTIRENILFPLAMDDSRPDEVFFRKIIHLLGLDERLNQYPHMLSGGGQQCAAIARALITKPAIILADEPTGSFDARTSQNVAGLLKMTAETFHQTLIMITHNQELAQLADRMVRLRDGRIVDE